MESIIYVISTRQTSSEPPNRRGTSCSSQNAKCSGFGSVRYPYIQFDYQYQYVIYNDSLIMNKSHRPARLRWQQQKTQKTIAHVIRCPYILISESMIRGSLCQCRWETLERATWHPTMYITQVFWWWSRYATTILICIFFSDSRRFTLIAITTITIKNLRPNELSY